MTTTRKARVSTRVNRGPRDRHGFISDFAEISIMGDKAVMDIFFMPVKPIRIFFNINNEPVRPEEIEETVEEEPEL